MILHMICFLMMLMVSAVVCAPGQVQGSKPRASPPGTLDPIGGGHLLRMVDPETEARNLMSLSSYQDDIPQNEMQQARKDKSRPSTYGTLDSLGGGHLLRIDDPKTEAMIFRSLELLVNHQDDTPQKMMLQSRKDNSTQRPLSSGTLDPIGGGNLVRIIDPGVDAEIFRSLEPLENDQGRQNMMRLAREDKSAQRSSHALDSIGNGHLVAAVNPYRGGQIYRSLDRSHLMDTLDNYQGGEVLRALDALTGSDLLSSLDSAEGMAVLGALKKIHSKHPKRMLDSVSGWSFGESKRNFDEIDNVGFTGFAKKSPYYRKQYEALAKKNFDEIDRAGFETYNKRDFDEIDRTGFENFEKRDAKE